MNLDYRIEHVDHNHGQEDMELGLYNSDNDEILGIVQYTLFEGELTIKDIIVRPEWRRKGLASRMMKYLKNYHNDYTYKQSMLTDLGSKFKHKDLDINENKKKVINKSRLHTSFNGFIEKDYKVRK